VKCDQVKEWASAALDGALGSDDSNSYFEHLQACPPCRLHHEEMRAALVLLTELPLVDAHDGFEEQVFRRIAESRKAPRTWWVMPSWARGFFGGELAHAGTGWSLAGVSAAVAALALVSSDPAPLQTATRVNDAAVPLIASAPGPEATASQKPAVDSEEEFIAGMPEAIRVYLQHGQDLRLPDSAERYRRSNYSYPVRRVIDPEPFQLTGEAATPSPAAGSDQDVTVISF
jgi:hypothetical protein